MVKHVMTERVRMVMVIKSVICCTAFCQCKGGDGTCSTACLL